MAARNELFKNVVQSKNRAKNNKITIIGCGRVGSVAAFSIVARGISNDVTIVSRNDDKVSGEILDLQQASCFTDNVKVSGGSDLSFTSDSRLIIFAAGIKRSEGENYLDFVQKNVKILQDLIPRLILRSPDATLLIVSEPTEVLTYVAWKLSRLPKHRVFGSGTQLDSVRFRSALERKFGMEAPSVHGYIVGERGEASIPVWSGVNVAGCRLRDINELAGLENDDERWSKVFEEVVNIDDDVKRLKGWTSYGIGLCCADIASAVLESSNEAKTVATFAKGLYGIKQEVFMSFPCKLNQDGVAIVVNIKLSEDECRKLRASANLLDEIQKTIIF